MWTWGLTNIVRHILSLMDNLCSNSNILCLYIFYILKSKSWALFKNTGILIQNSDFQVPEELQQEPMWLAMYVCLSLEKITERNTSGTESQLKLKFV